MDALPVQFRVEYYVTLLAAVCHFIIPVDKKMKSTGCCGNHMRSKICVAQKMSIKRDHFFFSVP